MHFRKTRPKLSILDGIMDAVSNGLKSLRYTVAVHLFAEGLSVYPWHRTPFCPKISIFSIMRLLQSQHNYIIKKAHSAILSREFCSCWYLLPFPRRFYLSESWSHRWKFRKKPSSFSTWYVWSSAISQEMMMTSFSKQIASMICMWNRFLKCAAGHEIWLILELTSEILSSHYSHAADLRLQLPSQWTYRSRHRNQSEKRLNLQAEAEHAQSAWLGVVNLVALYIFW